ncbi:MAG TPA: TPM domain-containing protein [Myxococcota bacterium]|nr:TPM domain-containing protein [Myxococcota bacterium]HRY95192.1 TPM domain-containing protein [Myxococcota bacterium]HSA20417.1 TPM domain-containing protein [Myxococcota bacterium]
MIDARRRVGWGLMLGSLVMACLPAAAREEPPAMDDPCVNDHGGLLGPKDLAAVRAVCEKARKQKIAITVVTVESLELHKSRLQGMERFVDDLFDEMDVEYEEQANAILLFVARKEREIRVRVGDGYAERSHKTVAGIIRGTVGPLLRRSPSAAVRKGVDRLWDEVGRSRVRELEKERQARERKRGIVNFEDEDADD